LKLEVFWNARALYSTLCSYNNFYLCLVKAFGH
jgi:hypothetical protein